MRERATRYSGKKVTEMNALLPISYSGAKHTSCKNEVLTIGYFTFNRHFSFRGHRLWTLERVDPSDAHAAKGI